MAAKNPYPGLEGDLRQTTAGGPCDNNSIARPLWIQLTDKVLSSTSPRPSHRMESGAAGCSTRTRSGPNMDDLLESLRDLDMLTWLSDPGTVTNHTRGTLMTFQSRFGVAIGVFSCGPNKSSATTFYCYDPVGGAMVGYCLNLFGVASQTGHIG